MSQGLWQMSRLSGLIPIASAPDSIHGILRATMLPTYLYSPTLLDSQVLSSQRCKKNTLASSTRTSTPGGLQSTFTIMYRDPCSLSNGMESFPGTQVTLQLTRILDGSKKGWFTPMELRQQGTLRPPLLVPCGIGLR